MTVSHPAIDELADDLDRIAAMGDRKDKGLDDLKHKIFVSRQAIAELLIRQEAQDPRQLNAKDIETLDRLDIKWAFLNSINQPNSQRVLENATHGRDASGNPTLAAHFRRVLADPSLATKTPERATVEKLGSPALQRS